MIKKLLIIFLIFPAFFKAQEGLRPLGTNIGIIYSDLHKTGQPPKINNLQKNVASLQIPFREDFYYAYKQSYPDQTLWKDSSTFVNTGHAIAPPD
ncbi:MAG: hypothetical protein H0W61_18025, partial [Bacteroidetes bacterium]|nr:hypothetical protein [Bacteroidota bacterium]